MAGENGESLSQLGSSWRVETLRYLKEESRSTLEDWRPPQRAFAVPTWVMASLGTASKSYHSFRRVVGAPSLEHEGTYVISGDRA
jgi:hypothetical protein